MTTPTLEIVNNPTLGQHYAEAHIDSPVGRISLAYGTFGTDEDLRDRWALTLDHLRATNPENLATVEEIAWALLMLVAFGREQPEHFPPGTTAAGEGRRNAVLTSVAGTMRRRGMTATEIEAALSAVNAERCDPPLPEDEVRAIAESVARYPAAQA